MIGWLRGKVLSADLDGRVLLDVGGVGYEVSTPAGSVRSGAAEASREAPHEVELFVHTQLRQDCLELFGFADERTRRAFRILIEVPKVGPRTALGVLGALPVEELAAAVEREDATRLCKIPGVGKKTAERFVLELRGKLGGLGAPSGVSGAAPASRPRASASADRERLLGALTNMGYRRAEAEAAVDGLGERAGRAPVDELLREALAALAR